MDYTALHTELTTDPLAMGYAAHLTLPVTDDAIVANMLNALTGVGAGMVIIPTYTKESFATGILPAVQALPTATTALQAKWNPMLNVALAMGTVLYSAASPLLAGLITDGLMTQAQVDAFTKRTGSRAEVLFGAGTIIDWRDVAKSMGRMS